MSDIDYKQEVLKKYPTASADYSDFDDVRISLPPLSDVIDYNKEADAIDPDIKKVRDWGVEYFKIKRDAENLAWKSAYDRLGIKEQILGNMADCLKNSPHKKVKISRFDRHEDLINKE